MSESRVRIILAGSGAALATGCLGLRLLHEFEFVSEKAPGWVLGGVLPRLQGLVAGWSLESMVLYPFGLLAILLLERLYPAMPAQRTLSAGLVHDALWVLIAAASGVLVVGWYSRLLYGAYTEHLNFLALPVPDSVPVPVRLVIGVVVLDLARWCQHWLHHHVTWLWPFHAVHHAQRELNLFSDYRNHFMEHVVRVPASVLPMLMLGLDPPRLVWWILFRSWHARLYHANIQSNFGPLRYLLVTPQSHRVHHSRHPEHFDHNYGATLSVWDYLFGTQYRRYEVYPETGVQDEQFPVETTHSVSGVLITSVRQMLYPFRSLWRAWQRDSARALYLAYRREGR